MGTRRVGESQSRGQAVQGAESRWSGVPQDTHRGPQRARRCPHHPGGSASCVGTSPSPHPAHPVLVATNRGPGAPRTAPGPCPCVAPRAPSCLGSARPRCSCCCRGRSRSGSSRPRGLSPCCFPSAVLFQHLIIYRGLRGRLYRGSYCLIELLDSGAAKIITRRQKMGPRLHGPAGTAPSPGCWGHRPPPLPVHDAHLSPDPMGSAPLAAAGPSQDGGAPWEQRTPVCAERGASPPARAGTVDFCSISLLPAPGSACPLHH